MKAGYFLVLALLALAVALSIVALYPSTADYGPENSSWNGYSSFMSSFNVELVYGASALDPSRDLLIVIPYKPLSLSELSAVKSFVERGGRLLLLTEGGRGEEVVEALGLRVGLPRGLLRDPLFNYRGPELPKAFIHGRVEGVDVIALNCASVLTGVPEDNVLAWSSSFSYLDLNLNGQRDLDEPAGPLPVAAEFKLGSGSVVLVSDPSIAINSMLGVEDNRAFLQALIEDRRPHLLVTTLPSSPLDEAKQQLGAFYGALLKARLIVIVAAVAVAALVLARFARGGSTA
ncbi:MAG: hypothetical protein DRJ97_08240 [Thermoprotei archaeon]|nr:MAG: hypothetical protein DRJ97_08240 [Thermoprotei archaeon]